MGREEERKRNELPQPDPTIRPTEHCDINSEHNRKFRSELLELIDVFAPSSYWGRTLSERRSFRFSTEKLRAKNFQGLREYIAIQPSSRHREMFEFYGNDPSRGTRPDSDLNRDVKFVRKANLKAMYLKYCSSSSRGLSLLSKAVFMRYLVNYFYLGRVTAHLTQAGSASSPILQGVDPSTLSVIVLRKYRLDCELVIGILSFLPKNRALLDSAGAVSRSFYGLVLSSWNLLRIAERTDLELIPNIVLQVAREIFFESRKFSSAEVKKLMQRMTLRQISKMTFHDFGNVRFERLYNPLEQIGRASSQRPGPHFSNLVSLVLLKGYFEFGWRRKRNLSGEATQRLRFRKIRLVKLCPNLQFLRGLPNLSWIIGLKRLRELRCYDLEDIEDVNYRELGVLPSLELLSVQFTRNEFVGIGWYSEAQSDIYIRKTESMVVWLVWQLMKAAQTLGFSHLKHLELRNVTTEFLREMTRALNRVNIPVLEKFVLTRTPQAIPSVPLNWALPNCRVLILSRFHLCDVVELAMTAMNCLRVLSIIPDRENGVFQPDQARIAERFAVTLVRRLSQFEIAQLQTGVGTSLEIRGNEFDLSQRLPSDKGTSPDFVRAILSSPSLTFPENCSVRVSAVLTKTQIEEGVWKRIANQFGAALHQDALSASGSTPMRSGDLHECRFGTLDERMSIRRPFAPILGLDDEEEEWYL